MGLSFGRAEIGLALLQMFNLASGVFRANKTAVEASYFITLEGVSTICTQA